NNAERVYIRTSNDTNMPTRLFVRDAVDGGPATYKVVFGAKGALTGFALSADGSKVWVGGALDGVNMANTTDFQFAHQSDIQAGCLASSADGLWACSNELSGFVAGISTDEGKTFTPRLHFCDIGGPYTCPSTTNTFIQCNPAWPLQKANLGCGADG